MCRVPPNSKDEWVEQNLLLETHDKLGRKKPRLVPRQGLREKTFRKNTGDPM